MNTAPETGERNGTSQLSARETAGEVFEDGGMIELVRDAEERSRLALLVSVEGNHEVLPSFERDNQLYVPSALDCTATKAIRLPTHVAEFGATAELITSMTGLIQRFTGLEEDLARCAAFFALATWFVDCSPEAPLLVLTGPPPEALRLLWILSCFCRHGLLLRGLGANTVTALPLAASPTLLIDAQRLSLSVRQRLTVPGRADFYLPHKRALIEDACAKVIYTGEEVRVTNLQGGIWLAVPPAAPRTITPLLRGECNRIAKHFQPKLLGYRLAKHGHVLNSKFDVPQLTAGLRDIGRIMGACLEGEPQWQTWLVDALERQDAMFREERASSLEASLIIALCTLARERNYARVKEINDLAHTIRKDRGDTTIYTDKKIGLLLDSLQIERCSRKVVFTSQMKAHIEDLARRWGIALVHAKEPSALPCDTPNGRVN